MSTKKVLVISHDKVGPSMAGPGIRYHQIATELSKHFDTSLGVFNPSYIDGLENTEYKAIDIKTYDFKSEFEKYDAIFALWLSQEMIEYSRSKGIKLIFDLYAPVPVEDYIGRVYGKRTSKVQDKEFLGLVENYRYFLTQGDYFVCSNPIQKDFWTGFAFATKSLVPGLFKNFDIHNRLGLLPMGLNLDDLDTINNENPLLKEFPEIKKDDFLIVWTGGIWDWFDGTTVIEAIKKLVAQGVHNVKFVFLGTKHPNPEIPEMGETVRSIELAKGYGLLNKYVFFREGWIPYQNRLNYLKSAKIALYSHSSELEARYSHRTRVLDHILLGLPTIATRGDYLTSVIEEHGFGIAIDPQNVESMVQAISNFTSNPRTVDELRQNIEKAKNDYTWSQSVKPLVEFLKSDLPPRVVMDLGINETKSKFIKNNDIRILLKRITPERIKKLTRKFIY